jgi:MFS family permease
MSTGRLLAPALMFISLVVAAVGSLGAPLITSVAGEFDVSLAAAQWTLTAPLLVGAIATPVLGRLGTSSRRRQVILATLAVVVAGSLLTVVPPSFGWLLAGRVAQGAGLGLTALQCPGRLDLGRPHASRLDLPHRRRLHDSVLARCRGGRRHSRRRTDASARFSQS